ncbi:nucleotidyltransferase [Gorillibacterium timonense]|uniref:nucleotidyltransferase n=1 Tax=Gorillibacterium timonense TaxID=1689269 RepID=UPI00071D62A0|nr:nucleotidyltransferase [Gorillibacterium timonense]
MRTAGIIVEYNPLHNGHVHHYREAKLAASADALIAVMSGPFLQRGEPALCSKWARAEMALHMGADLVIELPTAFAVQPAEWFAYGAVSALEATGVADALVFGSESGSIAWFRELAALLRDEPPALKARLKERLAAGASYPAAYASAAASLADGPDAGTLAQPNNILGLQYCLALERLKSGIVPLTIPRLGAGYHDREAASSSAADGIASATAVRKLLLRERGAAGLAAAAPYLPDYTVRILRREWEAGRGPMEWESFASPLFHLLLTRPASAYAELAEITEGIEHRFLQAVPGLDFRRDDRVTQLLAAAKTRRYTHARLQRALLSILLDRRKEDVTREVLERGVPYLRVLGFSACGRELLKRMKESATVPVVTKVTKEASPLLELDIRAASAYAAAYAKPDSRELLRDYYQAPLQTEA